MWLPYVVGVFLEAFVLPACSLVRFASASHNLERRSNRKDLHLLLLRLKH